MDTHLPIAGITVNFFVLLSLGAFSGFISGLYGIGGGIIATPVMVFFGIPSNIVVGTASFQLLGSAIAGTMRNMVGKFIDFKAASVMLIGGLAGSTMGAQLLMLATKKGTDDLIVTILFIIIMVSVLVPMCTEMMQTFITKQSTEKKLHQLQIVTNRRLAGHSGKPFMVYSRIAQIEYNIFIMIFIGLVVGLCSGLIGIGGGIISIPIMTYFLGIPFRIASGIALFQVVVVSVNNLLWHVKAGNVDIVLGLVLLLSSTFTVQLGSVFQSKLRPKVLQMTFTIILTVILVLFLVRLYKQPSSLLMVG
ncbi:MAG: sulfite exporter TauE/SafE family protein [Alphaproteobacteria bacterium]|nr:sulfite exporter TauE/SafE family protein [Rickettsiales bacterium]